MQELREWSGAEVGAQVARWCFMIRELERIKAEVSAMKEALEGRQSNAPVSWQQYSGVAA